MYEIEIYNLSKRYILGNKFNLFDSFFTRKINPKKVKKEIWALKNISLKVEEGTVLGIIGHNGAGKSTLLKILAKVIVPTSGTVKYYGRVSSLLELGVGFQPEYTARENILFQGKLCGLTKKEIDDCYGNIIEFAELKDFENVPIKKYSSGMEMRLNFSVAINMKPDILLADEVLAVGDISFQNKCLNRLQETGKSGVTVLFVSHDMEAIKRLCDRCICIHKGEVIDNGTPEDVVSRYEELEYSNNKKATSSENIEDEYLKIVSISLLSKDFTKVAVIDDSQDNYIEIKLQAKKDNIIATLLIDCYVDNIVGFRSIYPETISLNKGEYNFLLKLPNNFFAPHNLYSITCGIKFFHDDKEYKLNFYDALEFKVYRFNEKVFPSKIVFSKKAGLFSPQLSWIIK